MVKLINFWLCSLYIYLYTVNHIHAKDCINVDRSLCLSSLQNKNINVYVPVSKQLRPAETDLCLKTLDKTIQGIESKAAQLKYTIVAFENVKDEVLEHAWELQQQGGIWVGNCLQVIHDVLPRILGFVQDVCSKSLKENSDLCQENLPVDFTDVQSIPGLIDENDAEENCDIVARQQNPGEYEDDITTNDLSEANLLLVSLLSKSSVLDIFLERVRWFSEYPSLTVKTSCDQFKLLSKLENENWVIKNYKNSVSGGHTDSTTTIMTVLSSPIDLKTKPQARTRTGSALPPMIKSVVDWTTKETPPVYHFCYVNNCPYSLFANHEGKQLVVGNHTLLKLRVEPSLELNWHYSVRITTLVEARNYRISTSKWFALNQSRKKNEIDVQLDFSSIGENGIVLTVVELADEESSKIVSSVLVKYILADPGRVIYQEVFDLDVENIPIAMPIDMDNEIDVRTAVINARNQLGDILLRRDFLILHKCPKGLQKESMEIPGLLNIFCIPLSGKDLDEHVDKAPRMRHLLLFLPTIQGEEHMRNRVALIPVTLEESMFAIISNLQKCNFTHFERLDDIYRIVFSFYRKIVLAR